MTTPKQRKPRLTPAQLRALTALASGRWQQLDYLQQARLARTLSDLSVRAWSEVKADVYNGRVPTADNPDFNKKLKDILYQVRKFCGDGNVSLLDVGAGHGRDAVWFQQQGLDVSLLEPSTNFMRFLEQLLADGILKPTNIMQADARNVPAADNSYDAVLAMAMLQHLPLMPGTHLGADEVMAQMARIIKPGGIIFVSVMEGEGCETSPITAVPHRQIFWQWYTRPQMRELLARHGFEVVAEDFNPDHSHKFVADKRSNHKPWINFIARLKA